MNMAWMTTSQRQQLFRGYFQSYPAVSLDEYALSFPKHAHYVRGIIRATHYALETLEVAHDLFFNKNYDLANDAAIITNARESDVFTVIAAIERVTLVVNWTVSINQLKRSDVFGRIGTRNSPQ